MQPDGAIKYKTHLGVFIVQHSLYGATKDKIRLTCRAEPPRVKLQALPTQCVCRARWALVGGRTFISLAAFSFIWIMFPNKRQHMTD
jgi:hypothetical protein